MFNLIPWKRKARQEREEKRPGLPDRFWDPFGTGDFFPAWPFSETGTNQLKVDVKDGRTHITVKAEIPGVDKKDLDISLENGVLRIEGEKKEEKEDSDENFYRRESAWGRFCRRVELPAKVDESNVEAAYKKGVLTVKLKKAKDSGHRKVKVKSA
ncbi:MAG: Hsp20/alpha crystallin family protein [Desulfobacterales bacterium]